MLVALRTTKQEALMNKAECQQIASKSDITALFQMYTLPEGFVNIDHTTVTKHVRAVLNEMKVNMTCHL